VVLGGGVILAGLEMFRPLAMRRPPGQRLLRAALAALIFAVAIVPAGGFWYWRNARLTGNPVFPVTLTVVGHELPGIAPPESFNPGKEREFVSAPWRWIDQPFHERYSLESGFGAPVAVLAPLAAVLVAATALGRLSGHAPLPLAALPLLLSLGSLYLWARGSREARHLLPAVMMMVPLVAVLPGAARRLRPWITAAVLGTLLIALRTAVFSTSHEQGPVLGKTWEDYYALPAAYEGLPAGAVIENRAGRTYNDPAQGRGRQYRVRPFVDGPPPDLATLRYHAVRYVLWRGVAGEPRPPGRTLWRRSLEGHRWWEVRPGQTLEMIQLDDYR
jgi:hypothetical protein